MVDSKRVVKVGLVQDAWDSDASKHKQSIKSKVMLAAQQGAQLVVLQELTLHRYFGDKEKDDAEVLALAEELHTGPTSLFCNELAVEAKLHVVGSLFEKALIQNEVRYFNTAIVSSPEGKVQFFTRKQHIPSGVGYNETAFFEPGDSDYPVHDLGFIKLACPTCYDQWFPELARIYALKGAELIVYPTAIGTEPTCPDFDSQPLWEKLISSHAVANGVFVAAVNRVGFEGTITCYGSSFAADPCGTIIAKASRDQKVLLMAELNFETFDLCRRLFPLLTQRQPATYGKLTEQN